MSVYQWDMAGNQVLFSARSHILSHMTGNRYLIIKILFISNLTCFNCVRQRRTHTNCVVCLKSVQRVLQSVPKVSPMLSYVSIWVPSQIILLAGYTDGLDLMQNNMPSDLAIIAEMFVLEEVAKMYV